MTTDTERFDLAAPRVAQTIRQNVAGLLDKRLNTLRKTLRRTTVPAWIVATNRARILKLIDLGDDPASIASLLAAAIPHCDEKNLLRAIDRLLKQHAKIQAQAQSQTQTQTTTQAKPQTQTDTMPARRAAPAPSNTSTRASPHPSTPAPTPDTLTAITPEPASPHLTEASATRATAAPVPPATMPTRAIAPINPPGAAAATHEATPKNPPQDTTLDTARLRREPPFWIDGRYRDLDGLRRHDGESDAEFYWRMWHTPPPWSAEFPRWPRDTDIAYIQRCWINGSPEERAARRNALPPTAR